MKSSLSRFASNCSMAICAQVRKNQAFETSKSSRMNVPKKLLSKTSGDSKKSGETTCIGKKELLGLGARCYGQALKLQSESDTMWHDIGANYFWQAEEYEAQEAKDLANKALQCLKKSVTLDPQNFRHWISLGVVAASKGTIGL